MINFIISDLENSLLKNGETQISEEIIDLILKLKEKEIKFAVATGKNYDSVHPMFGKAKNDIIYICNDGGAIFYKDQLISKTPVNRRICFEVVAEAEKNKNLRLVFSGEKAAMVTTRDADFVNHLKSTGIETEYVKDVKAIHEDITKITIFVKGGLDEELYKYFYTKWVSMANVAVSTAEQAYLTGEGVTKGNALALVQHLFDTTEEDTVVFASNYSGIDMFKHSYFSYALQNADGEIKKSAKHITENIEMILEDILRMQ